MTTPDTSAEVERIRALWDGVHVDRPHHTRYASWCAPDADGALSETVEARWWDSVGCERALGAPDDIATLLAEIDRLRAQLPDPAAVQCAREMAARVIGDQVEILAPVQGSDEAAAIIIARHASRLVATLYDLARTVRARTDEGGDVDHLTLLDVALRVDACTSLDELESIARELREVW